MGFITRRVIQAIRKTRFYYKNILNWPSSRNNDLCPLMCEAIWEEASQSKAYDSDKWISFYSVIPFLSINLWHKDWSEGWPCTWPVPLKGQKKERTKRNHQKDIKKAHIISKHNTFPLFFLTRRRCAGCWLWAAPGTLWWRSPRCCCSSGCPGTVAHRAGLPQTPWRRTPARTATSTSPPCPPPAGPPLHPSHREKLRGVRGV